MNLTDSDVELRGNQYTAYGDSSSSKCSTTSGTTVGNFFIYNLVCYTPRAGRFVFSVEEDTAFNGTITFSFQNCPAGMGGYNCSFPEAPFNLTTLAAAPLTVTVPTGTTGWLSYPQNIYYVDIPANFPGTDLFFFFTSTQSAYLQVRINGYPEYYSPYGYEDSSEGQSIGTGRTTWALTNFDYQFPGRYYFAVLCTASTACSVEISLNGTQTSGSSSSASSTTGAAMSTTASTTGSTTGRVSSTTGSTTATGTPVAVTTAGVEYLVPSLVLLLVSLLF
jgi:hypothetical protein